MTLLLPAFAWAGIAAGLHMAWPDLSLRHIALRACVLWSAALVVLTEALSLAGWITPAALSGAWTAVLLGTWLWVAWSWRRGKRPDGGRIRLPQSGKERALWAIVITLLLLTGALALLAPPQSWDSFNYRMSRVAHWAQQASLDHFATGIEQQNSRPPWAEMAVLQGYVLTQSDRLANLTAWLAFLAAVVGASLIAGWLGASGLGQAFAAVFVATTPMAIVQASSTMNDLVAALWTLIVAAEALWLWRVGGRTSTWGFLGLAAGLALLTKPIAAPYLAVFLLVALLGTVRRRREVGALLPVFLAGTLAVSLNAGPLLRSMATYGSPLEGGQVAVHANLLLEPRALLSNALRNVSLHLGTPSGHVNKAIALGIEAVHRLIGLDPSDPRTTAHTDFEVKRPTKIETRVGNPLQMLLILAAVPVLLLRRRALPGLLLLFAAAAITGFLLYSFLFKWQLFGSRYHLPFFLLMAPVVAGVLENLMSPKGLLASAVVLFLACLPWLLSLDDRPWIATRNSDSPSVLTATRQEMYFANARALASPFLEVRDRIQSAGCQQVGLALSGNSAEYLWWALLGAPRGDVHLEWLVSGTPSARYRADGFEPCAVICEGCPASWTEARGLPLAWRQGGVRLFLAPTEG